MIQYGKVQSVSKVMLPRGKKLSQTIRGTLAQVASIVGSTLGPGGQTVIIERQEAGMPPMVTKDGVTVFRNMGFADPTAQTVMESARDAAVRTASEAGDGTTTATILAEAIDRLSDAYRTRNPRISPQKVVRKLAQIHREVVAPAIRDLALRADLSTPGGKAMLWNVAKISANGDEALADAVISCFEATGDDGNVTITEVSGPSGCEVERIDGYTIPIGWEDCCVKYGPGFLTDPANLRVVLEKPAFVVFHGRISDIQSITLLMERIGALWQTDNFRHNVVLVATGFSDSVLAQLAINFAERTSINVFPLLAPLSILHNGQLGFLEDVCAVTGAKMFDPITKPLDNFAEDLSELGCLARQFESSRFRSAIIGDQDNQDANLLIEERVQILQAQALQAASDLDAEILKERIGKLTSGIARLKVVGASNGELRERRDRAEDAVCAVRGAIRHGCLPGGGWTLARLAGLVRKLGDPVGDEILAPALEEPIRVLFRNCGFDDDEIAARVSFLAKDAAAAAGSAEATVYDALEHREVPALAGGILDSAPAVSDAIKNSLSIAAQLGTTGATIVFARDPALERKEAADTASFLRDASYSANPADERPM